MSTAQFKPMTQGQASLESHPLTRRIAAFVRSWGREGDFSDLSLELFQYQYQHNVPYRRFCNSRGAVPGQVNDWGQILAVPTDAFRTQMLTCSPDDSPAAVFQTSGTTGNGGRGSHWMDALALEMYSLSLHHCFARLADRAIGLPVRALLAPCSESPDSSLSFMVSSLADRAAREEPGKEPIFFWKGRGPDLEGARRSFSNCQEPVLLFTTAFGLLELLDSLDSPLGLHPESMVIETGGFKGRRRTLKREDLYRLTVEKLGIPWENIGSEYGMCEMASQFYDTYLSSIPEHGPSHRASLPGPLLPIKRGPPWVRSQLVDPATGEIALPGQSGVLRHYDLCNFNSVMAIQTADVAFPATDLSAVSQLPSAQVFILQGRLFQSPPRGCSLTIEDWRDRRSGGE